MHAACWAHARRKLFDEFERTESPIAEEALRRIQNFYAIEAEIAGKTAGDRRKIRRDHALPVLTELKSWMTEQRRRLSSKIGLAKALQYTLTRWDALCLYTEDGRLGIDTDVFEQPFFASNQFLGGFFCPERHAEHTLPRHELSVPSPGAESP
jgi:transposase